LVTLNKAFNDTLNRLERYRQRPAEGRRDAPEVPPPADAPEVPMADAPEVAAAGRVVAKPNRAARRQAARAEMRAAAIVSRAAWRQAARPPPGEAGTVLPNTCKAADDANGLAFCQADEQFANRHIMDGATILRSGPPDDARQPQ
jgi:hypothetical protein